MNGKSLRVYFTTHQDGRLTGQLLPVWDSFFDAPPPSAYGTRESEVYALLETRVRQLLLEDSSALDRFLWEETLEARTLTVEIHPQTLHQKRPVIAKALIPLRLTYVYGKLESGAWRVRVPRFGWSFVLEDLSIAREVLRSALTTALLGENPKSLYDFRHEGEEYVQAWDPGGLRQDARRDSREERPAEVLDQVGEELTSRALGGRQPPLVYDAGAMREWLELVRRQPLPSLLLVGGSGTGKTSHVLMLARRIAELRREDKTARLPDIWRTSAERIVAGMVYLGMWQERCLKLVDALSFEDHYLFVDRLTSLLAPQPDGSSIGDLLLPAAMSGEISLIAECTEAEFERCQRRFPEALRPFRVLRIESPVASRMPELMLRYQSVRRSRVSIHPVGMRQLVGHLETFQRDSLFPGKAFRFLDWLDQQGERGTTRTLYPRDASEAYARYTGLPLQLISDEVPAERTALASQLQKGVMGQEQACELAAGVLARFKAGLNDPDKPVGTLLFAGPTGVGKTELSKQLARTLFGNEDRMIRLDMSEYMLPGSAQRLMEVGPGISSLAERVRRQPLSLVLFDELEKAHADVFDLLLGILGEGRLTDHLGRLVDFRMTVVCMTSNLGVEQSEPAGFGAERGAEDFLRAIRQAFRPELFNRIDHVIPFRRLSEGDVLRIVDLELEKAASRAGLLRRGLRLVVDADARAWLARHGHEPMLGARPLKRLIEARVMAPIAVRLAADARLEGVSLPVVVAGSEAERRLGPEQRALATVLDHEGTRT
ncbi:AAA family ATPase [Melittangium boletus]|uniref:ATP-dependent Clp protease ATP-binding subunit ClpA n=1 Tax=Melittangium boletus DSM 14713 TaxID=1294270 RepID=A0A250IQA8_9BACT|nr:AAA family ATPase [Melittangium boletus]ATB33939.1 ATP-dependent Clp protease ATP-binding subunit ClpA [Melittangium boletus DSM 14713]